MLLPHAFKDHAILTPDKSCLSWVPYIANCPMLTINTALKAFIVIKPSAKTNSSRSLECKRTINYYFFFRKFNVVSYLSMESSKRLLSGPMAISVSATILNTSRLSYRLSCCFPPYQEQAFEIKKQQITINRNGHHLRSLAGHRQVVLLTGKE